MAKTVPFSVIGGFLGAGKTSLVNQLLYSAQQRYAVLVNDFGSLNIDSQLIKQHSGATLSLANGCICCSLAAGFSKGLGQVLDQLDSFDHIIVEASGIANPQRIQDIARIEPRLEVRGNLILVDGQQLLTQLADPHIAALIHQQIHCADLLLVNKQAGLSEADRRGITALLEQLTEAPFQFTDHGKIAASSVLSIKAQPPTAATARPELNNHDLFSRLVTVKDISYEQFLGWQQALSADILRGKGLLRFSDKSGVWLWQKVAAQQSLTRYQQPCDSSGQLVVIAKSAQALTKLTDG